MRGKFITIALLFLMAVPVQASRTPEIEQYYIDKVSSLLKTRFPETPFTVFVSVDTGDRNKEISRKKEIRRGETSSVQLPYLDVADEDVSIWDRTDVSLGTLIGLLDHVSIKVQIDSSVKESELKDLQLNIAKQLKLDANADSIEIARVDYTKAEKQSQKMWILIWTLLGFALFAGIFWYLSKLGVKQLVKGLAQPISEIGKSTQEFANSALNLAADMAQPPTLGNGPVSVSNIESDHLSHGSNLIEIRKSALELIQRNQEMFKNPDARFLSFLEQQGLENPMQVGAILIELDQESIKTLYKYGSGDWWFVALASPASLTPSSIKILNEIDRLRLRWNFEDTNRANQKSNLEAGIILSRLNEKEMVSLLKDVSLEEAEPILHLLPRSQFLSVAKKTYPGQWAKFLDGKKQALTAIKPGLIEKLLKKAVEIKPLRKEEQIQSFFADLDLVKYLDIADPRDERDFYMALPADSKIKTDRVPFYSVFDASQDVKKMLSGEIHAKDWAIVLAGCESNDQRAMLESFPDRLKFLVKEEMEKVDLAKVDSLRIRTIRRSIVQAFVRNNDVVKTKGVDKKNESQKTKAA